MDIKNDILRALNSEEEASKKTVTKIELIKVVNCGRNLYRISFNVLNNHGLKGKISDYTIINFYEDIKIIDQGKSPDEAIIQYNMNGSTLLGKQFDIVKTNFSILKLIDKFNIPIRYLNGKQKLENQKKIANHNFSELDFINCLNPQQRLAISQIEKNFGGVWGPPGTGKTSTFAKMIRSDYLINKKKILVVALSHEAVNVLLKKLLAESSNYKVVRYAQHFDYESLDEFAEKIGFSKAEIENTKRLRKNSDIDYQSYYEYKKEIQARNYNETKNRLDHGDFEIIAMTTMSALYNIDKLEKHKFDAIYFDEASQIPKLHFYTIGSVAERIYFAGDPNQLAPVVSQRTDTYHAKLLKDSIFDDLNTSIDDPRVVFLSEQYRMHPAICRCISNAYYNTRLETARFSTHENYSNWKRQRTFTNIRHKNIVGGIISPGVNLRLIEEHGFSKEYSSTRENSKNAVIEVTRALLTTFKEEDIMIISPVHAQNNKIRSELFKYNITNINVSTAHLSQGKERQVIIFDPVSGEIPLNQNDTGTRLINVRL